MIHYTNPEAKWSTDNQGIYGFNIESIYVKENEFHEVYIKPICRASFFEGKLQCPKPEARPLQKQTTKCMIST